MNLALIADIGCVTLHDLHFARSYKILAPKEMEKATEDKECATVCLSKAGLNEELYRCGNTKVSTAILPTFLPSLNLFPSVFRRIIHICYLGCNNILGAHIRSSAIPYIDTKPWA